MSDVTALEAKDQNGLARRRSWLPRKKRRSSGKNFSGPTSLPNAPGLPGAPQSQTAPPLSSATATLAAAFKSQLAYPDAVRPAASGGARWAHIKGEERAEQILASVVETWMGAASRTRSTTRTSRMSIGANGNNARMSSAGEYSSPEHRRRSSWTASFLDADPRRQILDFFMPGDERGPFGLLRSKKLQPSGKVVSKFFSIWRPTSFDAIRMMMEGKATGKVPPHPRLVARRRAPRDRACASPAHRGQPTAQAAPPPHGQLTALLGVRRPQGLNIKGKSAKKGKLSGFVPYIQIAEERHKTRHGPAAHPPPASPAEPTESALARALPPPLVAHLL